LSSNELIVSLDIGTSKVRVIIGEINNGLINIIGVGSTDSNGIKKGAIVDIDETVQSIRDAIDHAERMVGIQIQEVCVGISGNHIVLQSSHGVVAVSNEDREITSEDVERVIQASKVIALPPERQIIEVVPKQFLVDGLGDIHDPRGMIGVRLEVEATIITGAKTIIHNLTRCIERAGLSITGIVLSPLALGTVALSKDEKQMGVALVDIGAGATTVAIYENGGLATSTVLPIGGEYITNDIAIGLRTQTDVAEKVKLKFGCASVEMADAEQAFKVPRIGSNVEKEFNQVDLAHIIEPRVQEIFHLIRKEMIRLGYPGEIPGGYVLTGGTVSLNGILEVAQFELESTVRIAIPDFIGVRDPAFATGVGMIQYAAKHSNRRISSSAVKSKKKSAKATNRFDRLKSWLSEFI
jgi:cell division protein FtsA